MKLRIATSVATAAVLAFGISACRGPAPRHHLRHEQIAAHHWSDGRYAYQDNSGIWWWYVYSNGSTMRDGGSLTDSGSWARGAAPTDLAASEEVNASVTTLDGGSAPMSEAQATAEAQAEGGGISEASAGPSDASPSVGGGGESSSGGDSGGGGGDGGSSGD